MKKSGLYRNIRFESETQKTPNNYNLIRSPPIKLRTQPFEIRNTQDQNDQSLKNTTNIFTTCSVLILGESKYTNNQNIDKNKKYRFVGYPYFKAYNQKKESMKNSMKSSSKRKGLLINNSRFKLNKADPRNMIENLRASRVYKEDLQAHYSNDSKDHKQSKINVQDIDIEKSCSSRIIRAKPICSQPKRTKRLVQEFNHDQKIDKHRKNYEKLLEQTLKQQKQNMATAFWEQNLREPLTLMQKYNRKSIERIQRFGRLRAKGQSKKYKQIRWIKQHQQQYYIPIDSDQTRNYQKSQNKTKQRTESIMINL